MKRRDFKKRIVAMLLATVMAVAVFPVGVMANPIALPWNLNDYLDANDWAVGRQQQTRTWDADGVVLAGGGGGALMTIGEHTVGGNDYRHLDFSFTNASHIILSPHSLDRPGGAPLYFRITGRMLDGSATSIALMNRTLGNNITAVDVVVGEDFDIHGMLPANTGGGSAGEFARFAPIGGDARVQIYNIMISLDSLAAAPLPNPHPAAAVPCACGHPNDVRPGVWAPGVEDCCDGAPCPCLFADNRMGHIFNLMHDPTFQALAVGTDGNDIFSNIPLAMAGSPTITVRQGDGFRYLEVAGNRTADHFTVDVQFANIRVPGNPLVVRVHGSVLSGGGNIYLQNTADWSQGTGVSANAGQTFTIERTLAADEVASTFRIFAPVDDINSFNVYSIEVARPGQLPATLPEPPDAGEAAETPEGRLGLAESAARAFMANFTATNATTEAALRVEIGAAISNVPALYGFDFAVEITSFVLTPATETEAGSLVVTFVIYHEGLEGEPITITRPIAALDGSGDENGDENGDNGNGNGGGNVTPPPYAPTVVVPGIPYFPAQDTTTTRNEDAPVITETVTIAGGNVDVRIVGGRAAVVLPPATVNRMIEEASDTATFDLSSLNIISAALPRSAVRSFARAGLAIEVVLPQGSLALGAEATNRLASVAHTANVTFRIAEIAEELLPETLLEILPAGANVHQAAISAGSRVFRQFDNTLITTTLPGGANARVWQLMTGARLAPVNATQSGGNVEFDTVTLGLFVVG